MWKDLSLKDKSALMQIMVNNGIYDLSTIRDTYNKFAEGGYVREQNNNPVAFDKEGNLVDQVTGEKGTMMLPEFTVRGISPKTRARNYSSAYDRYALSDLINWGLESTVGKALQPVIEEYPWSANVLKAITPSSYIGTLREGKAPWDLSNTGFGDSKDMQSANLLFDLTVGPKVAKDVNIASKLVGKGLINSAKELPYLFPKTRLYSDNPFVNAYATLARRYDLPDKARLPYLIRKIKSGNLNFTEDGLVDLTGSRWKHTNYTYDLGVIPHAKGSWDDAAQTLIINPRDFIKRNKWGSIEPSDMFTIDGTTPVSPKEVINITTAPISKGLSKAHGIQTFSTKILENIDQGLREAKDKASKLNLRDRLFNPKAMVLRRRQVNREKYDAVQEIINKFGRPKVKDVRLLEEMTGLKSYIHPIEDAQLFRQIDTDAIWATPIDQAEEIISKLPTFNNGRRFDYKGADSKGVQYPYRNFFYDPATIAESEFQFPLSDTK